MNCIPEQKIEGVYFTSRKLADMSSVTEIEKDRIYTAATENPYISYMNREMNSRRIVSLGRIHAFQKPDFRVHLVMPTFFVKEFLSVFSSSAKDMKEWKPALKRLTRVQEWIEGKIKE